MKTKVLLTTLVLVLIASAFGQKQTLDLTFTAVDNTAYVQLDSIKLMNRTQDSDTTLYWPDTTLTVDITAGDTLLYIGYITGYPVAVHEIIQEKDQFRLFQNYPNPVKDQSVISIYVPEEGVVSIMVTDVQGRAIITNNWRMDIGNHSFRFTPGGNHLYFLTALWKGESRSIKILTTVPNTGMRCILEYIGNTDKEATLRASKNKSDMTMLESGILDAPSTNETYTFQFATNVPCPGTPSVTYEGQVYNTIQIFSQCWLKENLNVGTMIPGTQNMSNNSMIEKYCYNNEPDSCSKYGGIYQWDEMMQYTSQQGVQGICPLGWHLPTDEEWKVLEGAVDGKYGIGDPEWDIDDAYRGFDAGLNLKSTSGWNYEGNGTDLFGFSGLPGGGRYGTGGYFVFIGNYGFWWSSTENDYHYGGWNRYLDYDNPEVLRRDYPGGEGVGFSVRCLRDN
jgi:uncharacterized protein (TIGR02145 family)